jgi:hypothetical protein
MRQGTEFWQIDDQVWPMERVVWRGCMLIPVFFELSANGLCKLSIGLARSRIHSSYPSTNCNTG